MDPIAILRNVTKTFPGRRVLESVNLQILDGEILALLGPNGSGKTTLLKILGSILRPTNGEVYLAGTKVTDQNIEKLRLETTLVFQKTATFSTTVYDNIAYGLKIRKISKNEIEERVAQALKLVRLEGFEKRPARKLSGGERQRVALARALALNTKLLLLDEPTANLDPKNAAIIEETTTATNRQLKTTIVMATHNMFQARSLSHRIALINDGKIGEIGTPTEIFGRLSKHLASFAMLENTFFGTAKTQQSGTTLVDIGNGVHLEAAFKQNGPVTVIISPQDIILSQSPILSSARNVIKGRITEILDLDPAARLRVDAGKPFTVQITKSSFKEMQLTLGSEIYMVFKASNVQLV